MYKKLLRGSLFITLMLIISVTLSGCSFNIGDIVSGLKNTLGSVIKGVGTIIQKAVPVVKKVVEAVKPVVSAVSTAISTITGKTNGLVDTFDKAIGKVNGVLDKVSDVGGKLVETGQSWMGTSDAGGNTTTGNVTTKQTVPDPTKDIATVGTATANIATATANVSSDDSDNKDTTKKGKTLEDIAKATKEALGDNAKVEIINGSSTREITGNETEPKANTNLTALKDDMLTDDERIDYTNKVRNGFKDMLSSCDALEGLINSGVKDSYNNKKARNIAAELKECKGNLESIIKDPTSAESEKKYKQLVKKMNSLRKEVKSLTTTAEEFKSAMVDVMNDVEDAVAAIDRYFGKLNGK